MWKCNRMRDGFRFFRNKAPEYAFPYDCLALQLACHLVQPLVSFTSTIKCSPDYTPQPEVLESCSPQYPLCPGGSIAGPGGAHPGPPIVAMPPHHMGAHHTTDNHPPAGHHAPPGPLSCNFHANLTCSLAHSLTPSSTPHRHAGLPYHTPHQAGLEPLVGSTPPETPRWMNVASPPSIPRRRPSIHNVNNGKPAENDHGGIPRSPRCRVHRGCRDAVGPGVCVCVRVLGAKPTSCVL